MYVDDDPTDNLFGRHGVDALKLVNSIDVIDVKVTHTLPYQEKLSIPRPQSAITNPQKCSKNLSDRCPEVISPIVSIPM